MNEATFEHFFLPPLEISSMSAHGLNDNNLRNMLLIV